jgi:hypothetical protein
MNINTEDDESVASDSESKLQGFVRASQVKPENLRKAEKAVSDY